MDDNHYSNDDGTGGGEEEENKKGVIIPQHHVKLRYRPPEEEEEENFYESSPERKKLRSCEPDLKVTIGSGDENNKKVVRWYHAAIIANHSGYIDAMLASCMKESQTNTINFPDITPETWDLMLQFLEDPTEARCMTVEDVMLVANSYDKYDFVKGRQLCSQVLVEYFRETRRNEIKEPSVLNLIVDAVALAHEANLEGGKQEGMKYLWKKLTSFHIPYGRTMFTESHIRKIVPLLLADDDDDNCGDNRKNGWYWNKEDIQSPGFPKLFVHTCSTWVKDRELEKAIPCIRLSETKSTANGDYWRENLGFDRYICDDTETSIWGGVPVKFVIERKVDNWAIVRETLPLVDEDGEEDYESVITNICWESPYSENLPLPPMKKWRSVDPLARGTPKITYIYRSNNNNE